MIHSDNLTPALDNIKNLDYGSDGPKHVGILLRVVG